MPARTLRALLAASILAAFAGCGDTTPAPTDSTAEKDFKKVEKGAQDLGNKAKEEAEILAEKAKVEAKIAAEKAKELGKEAADATAKGVEKAKDKIDDMTKPK